MLSVSTSSAVGCAYASQPAVKRGSVRNDDGGPSEPVRACTAAAVAHHHGTEQGAKSLAAKTRPADVTRAATHSSQLTRHDAKQAYQTANSSQLAFSTQTLLAAMGELTDQYHSIPAWIGMPVL